MKKIIIFFLPLLFISCSLWTDNAVSLKLGDKTPSSAVDSGKYYLTTSGALEQVYSYEENNLTFDVMTDNNGSITFFKTEDENFETPCGVKIGDTVKDVELKKMLGMGEYVVLTEGWYASVDDAQKVLFLFKSRYH